MSANTEQYMSLQAEISATRVKLAKLEQAAEVLRLAVGKEAELIKGDRTSTILFNGRVVKCVKNRRNGFDIYEGKVAPANRIAEDLRSGLSSIKRAVVMGQL